MRNLPRLTDVRVEAVTEAFVASGRPEGIHDLGRFLENLNNPAVAQEVELAEPSLRPLYSATQQLALGAPLLVRRAEIIFATFEGPYYTRGTARSATVDVQALLLAPPFQIQGLVALAAGSDATPALRTLARGFFVVRKARVFDADGNALGDGEQIVVNGAAVQMMSATRQHFDAAAAPSKRALEAVEAPAPEEARETRAA